MLKTISWLAIVVGFGISTWQVLLLLGASATGAENCGVAMSAITILAALLREATSIDS
jgi:hypothetical protein